MRDEDQLSLILCFSLPRRSETAYGLFACSRRLGKRLKRALPLLTYRTVQAVEIVRMPLLPPMGSDPFSNRSCAAASPTVSKEVLSFSIID